MSIIGMTFRPVIWAWNLKRRDKSPISNNKNVGCCCVSFPPPTFADFTELAAALQIGFPFYCSVRVMLCPSPV